MAVSEHWRVIRRRREMVKAFHRSGWTAREMAIQLAVSRWTVFQDLKHLGLKAIDGRKRVFTARQKHAYELWKIHKNYSIVGDLMGCAKSTARTQVLAYVEKLKLLVGSLS